jgi:hypothetical protein
MSVARLALLAVLLLAGCAHRNSGYVWDGRRGYNGSGDFGYDLNGSRSSGAGYGRAYTSAARYRAQAPSRYPVPGPSHDPWGPHIREASSRYGVPERWIRAIMQQESGGRLYFASGELITSRAGAMGLMQVMPGTYEMLRARYGLGPDPYHPRDNIRAGAAYIREMHDRFGAPNFAAAYNAGPERTAAWLRGEQILPMETENYLANVAPRLGRDAPVMLARAPAPAAPRVELAQADRAYAGGGSLDTGAAYDSTAASEPPPADPADRAYDGGGLVTPDAPTGRQYWRW